MTILFKKDNIYSNFKMKNSISCDIESGPYYGLEIDFDSSQENCHLNTLCGKIFRINKENLDAIIKTSTVKEGRLVGGFEWQPYKKINMLLPIGALSSAKPLVYGDIVTPVSIRGNYPEKLIYVGHCYKITYNSNMRKSSSPKQHVFIPLYGPNDRSTVYTVLCHSVIESAYIVLSNDVELADKKLNDLNTDHNEDGMAIYNYWNRTIYLADKSDITVKPVLAKISGTASHNHSSSKALVIKDGEDYYLTHTMMMGMTGGGQSYATEMKPIPINESIIVKSSHIKTFYNTKYVSKIFKDQMIWFSPNCENYAVVYEMYQNGKLVGRK